MKQGYTKNKIKIADTELQYCFENNLSNCISAFAFDNSQNISSLSHPSSFDFPSLEGQNRAENMNFNYRLLYLLASFDMVINDWKSSNGKKRFRQLQRERTEPCSYNAENIALAVGRVVQTNT